MLVDPRCSPRWDPQDWPGEMREAPLVDMAALKEPAPARTTLVLAVPTHQRMEHPSTLTPNQGHRSAFSLAFPAKGTTLLSKEGREKGSQ